MNRIDIKFKELKEKGEAAFIPFITAGDPNLEVTKALIMEFDRKGADIIELGIPFSDPIADGPCNTSVILQGAFRRCQSLLIS